MSRILLVDDEANILTALRRCLMARDDFDDTVPDYQLDAFTSPQAALKAAELNEYELVVSDYRMPEMDGVRFLTELRYIQPDCISLILSGMTDLDGLVRAINQASIHRFISKPWNDIELRASVTGALAQRRLQLENQRLADEVRQLHTRASNQAAELARLERESPGITKVQWGPDGSVLLDDDIA
ncbi:response regulator [Chitinimonas arctica]|uniref:Response regulator n=1 Tax=Chitinimonas arctica TaxID=2594795 RepID=A0A516SA08_9NEIS|nr:response regulator [Chitinimonas arctica]QDQ24991.1 response regulator [Chitinimonas arctica]